VAQLRDTWNSARTLDFCHKESALPFLLFSFFPFHLNSFKKVVCLFIVVLGIEPGPSLCLLGRCSLTWAEPHFSPPMSEEIDVKRGQLGSETKDLVLGGARC
jgi:hypothetical protein